jgi:hypothetical protein
MAEFEHQEVQKIDAGEIRLAVGGERRSTGGVYRLIARVLVENKLAVVGFGFIMFNVLICFLDPVFYHTS